MVFVGGVHLLPATGEFAYDTIPAQGAQRVAAGLGPLLPMNCFYAPGGSKTDYSYAIDQLQAAHPECTTVSVVCCVVFQFGKRRRLQYLPVGRLSCSARFGRLDGGVWTRSHWMVSSLTEAGLPGPHPDSDHGERLLRLRRHAERPLDRPLHPRPEKPRLQGRFLSVPTRDGFRLSLARPDHVLAGRFKRRDSGRGHISRPGDGRRIHSGLVNLTVGYAGGLYDWTYRRMILHYANLVASPAASTCSSSDRNSGGLRQSAGRLGRRPARRMRTERRFGITRSSPASCSWRPTSGRRSTTPG